MVSNITSLTGNGLKDWLIQRVTAVFLAVYTIYLLVFFLNHAALDFTTWSTLWSCKIFQITSIIAVFALTLHAWIGIWTVTTDYFKCTVLRLSIQMAVALWLLVQLLCCIMIVWGR